MKIKLIQFFIYSKA